ncbi:MAG TPA: ankyrin repeat domain-containing protein [Vicinamibacterales bacterium]|nr:ankyrin repeat domain-containing protein [Vicinamibacterales bacterium]
MAPAHPDIEALAAAVRADDAGGVARLLAGSPHLAAHLDEPMPGEGFGATPLLAAVHRNNREMVDILLRAGADVNARSHWWAGSFGVLDHDGPLSGFLIERGAVVDVHAASRLGMMDRLEALLSADPALVRARGGDGQTPLHFASSIEIARYLLDRGADIDARDVDHESTPAQWMIRDRQAVARYLVKRGCQTDLLMSAALGDEARLVACLDTDPAAIRTTVSDEYFPKQDPRSGGSIYNWTLGTGKTAHVIAHEFGHPGVVRTLMERSPDELRLAVACEIGDEAAAQALLASRPRLTESLTGADLRKLPDAARDQNREAVRLLLAAGWPVDARGQHGGTALHWAGWHGDTAMAGELLRHDPPLEIADHDYGGTPLFWAVYGSVHGWRCRTGDYAGTVKVLLEAGARPPDLTPQLEASGPVREVLVRWRASRAP